MKPDICIHHMPCADGFAAAWAIWKRWPDIKFHPGVYGQQPPPVGDKNVLIVDFSYKRPVLEQMARTARSITVLDHHKSAQADLATFARHPLNTNLEEFADGCAFMAHWPIQALFDMDKSGAVLAWEFAHPGEPVPRLLQHVQDRDLWRFDLPGTREIQAALFSYSYDFKMWDQLAEDCETDQGRSALITAGEAIERKHFKDIGELLAITTRIMVIGGQEVKVANLPYTMSSDAAQALAQGAPFGACYYDNGEGKRVFSLRSVEGGADVSAIASSYGGGGHARASGFTAAEGWCGDR